MSQPRSVRSRAAAPARLEAVLFDMDGVVTDTARAHAAAWKRLFDQVLRARGEAPRPFDPERDYRELVDGKPRHDGIRSFLRSRGVDLPEGGPDDPPEAETVVGLGRRKQRYFRAWLRDNQVRTYPGTLKLIRDLRELGVRTAVFSSSRNMEAVLRNAGALELFEVRVGGEDLAALALPGKPHPALLHEAAARLGVSPGRAAVIEDAVAGVEAGVRGGFALVIGVDRGDQRDDALGRAGAHLVVRDLSELLASERRGLTVKTVERLPGLLEHEDALRTRLSGRRPVVFLDYDGTLTPIVEDPARALLAADMRAAVAALARTCTVAIVSGRGLEHLRRLIDVDAVFLAGSHGLEIAGPAGSTARLERGVELLPRLDQAERRLREALAGIAGHEVERKRLSLAVHYRRAAREDVPRIAAIVDEALAERGGLRRGGGKEVFRIQPDVDWDKGRAALWILERLEPPAAEVLPIYVGDDLTDEDAFRALSGRGLTVIVRDHEARPTAADYAVADVAEVKRLLELITALSVAPARSAGGRR